MVSPAPRFGELVPSARAEASRTTAHYELTLVRSGTLSLTIDGAALEPAGPHGATLLPPGRERLARFVAGGDGYAEATWIHMPAASVPPDLAARLAAVPTVFPLSEQLVRLFGVLLRLRSSVLPTTDEMAIHAVLTMLWCVVGEAERRAARGSGRDLRPETVELAQAYIRQHLGEPITLTTIAQGVGISETHLNRLFRRHVGETPIAWMWHRRLGYALELLEETGLSIGQVAERSGFRTIYHFSRVAKEHTGMTPTEYRLRTRMTSS